VSAAVTNLSAWKAFKEKQAAKTAPAPEPKTVAPEPPREIIPMFKTDTGLIVDEVWTPTFVQLRLLGCPAFELLAWGNRGGGKSDWLLADFCNDVNTGLGADWRGLILRREYKDLADIVERSKKRIPKLFPGAKFNGSPEALGWTFPDGAKLLFRHAKRPADISQYLGQEWPWLGFDELCNWSDPGLYFDIMSCVRSSNASVRPRVRAATNPWGPGAWWVKERFIDAGKQGELIEESREINFGTYSRTFQITRSHLRMDFRDNDYMMRSDPSYLARIMPTDKAKRMAWIEGKWDLSVGGFFSGVWSNETHVIKPFRIPQGWRVDRAHDWGAASPHCTLYFAESDGSEVEIDDGVWYRFPKGTLFVIGEIYGWNGEPNKGRRDTDGEIARDIKAMDRTVQNFHACKVLRGPADTQIFNAPQGKAIIDTYRSELVDFDEADKSPGSRITGAKNVIDRMVSSEPFAEGRPMEAPGLFVFSTCKHVIRTVPKLQRDEKKPDDVDTDGEDHAYDPIRYRCLAERRGLMLGKM
jgi:hypothetical protein